MVCIVVYVYFMRVDVLLGLLCGFVVMYWIDLGFFFNFNS